MCQKMLLIKLGYQVHLPLGSAVGVSLGVVPFALGTQTAGSIVRPASYNGIYGIKPTFGMIPRTGCLKLVIL